MLSDKYYWGEGEIDPLAPYPCCICNGKGTVPDTRSWLSYRVWDEFGRKILVRPEEEVECTDCDGRGFSCAQWDNDKLEGVIDKFE